MTTFLLGGLNVAFVTDATSGTVRLSTGLPIVDLGSPPIGLLAGLVSDADGIPAPMAVPLASLLPGLVPETDSLFAPLCTLVSESAAPQVRVMVLA